MFFLFLFSSLAQTPDARELTTRICSQCHEIERAFSLHQDRDGWQATVDKMAGLGMSAKPEEIKQVVDYLAAALPGETVPKLNVNTATAIQFESALSLRRSQAAAVLEYRAKNGPFKSIEDLKKVPGIDAAKIEAKKDRLTF